MIRSAPITQTKASLAGEASFDASSEGTEMNELSKCSTVYIVEAGIVVWIGEMPGLYASRRAALLLINTGGK